MVEGENRGWKRDPFDTEIFGFPIGRILFPEGNYDPEDKLRVVLSEMKKENIRYAVCRIPADNFSLIQALEQNDFLLVDGLITLHTKVSSDQLFHFAQISSAKKADFNQLIALSGNVFRGITRYYHDPFLFQAKADEVYKLWMKNSLEGKVADVVLVSKDKNDILGFITLQKNGQIPLVAVSEKARGKGIGKSLLFAALDMFRGWGVTDVIIETQLSNIAALRLYQSIGFKISQSHLTYRWLDE